MVGYNHKGLFFSFGRVKSIKGYEFQYKLAGYFSSGCPIFLHGTPEIIGICKYGRLEGYYGTLINSII